MRRVGNGRQAVGQCSTGPASFGDSSTILTVVDLRPRVSITSPAERAFRTQATSPYGATSQRFSFS
jgi:hypothetical protein